MSFKRKRQKNVTYIGYALDCKDTKKNLESANCGKNILLPRYNFN